jgi:hypothetical protein
LLANLLADLLAETNGQDKWPIYWPRQVAARFDTSRFRSHYCLTRRPIAMSDLNRGIMKFDGADSPAAIILSSIIVLGGIALLVIWALNTAYALR